MSFGSTPFSGQSDGIQQPHRAHVGVQVHLEAHAQQDFFGMNIGGHARVAECSDEDGVEIAIQHGEAVGRNGDAVGEIAIGAPIKMGERKAGASCFENSDGMRDDFTPDSITRENGNALFGVHER